MSKASWFSVAAIIVMFLIVAGVTTGCAGAASSSRSSRNDDEPGRGVIASSSVMPIRTDSLEYTPRGTPPLQYIVIRATFTNVSRDTAYLGWCRAPNLPGFALEEYSAGAWHDPASPYGLTCLHERVPPLVLAPNESHTAVIELGWFKGPGPASHGHRDDLKLSGRTLRIVYTKAYRRPSTTGSPEPDAKLPRELRVSNAFRVSGKKEQ